MGSFNGLGMNLGNLSRVSTAKTRSISAENPTGAKGAGAMADPAPDSPVAHLGPGWKSRPRIVLAPGQTEVIADIEGPGAIQSMWMTGHTGRDVIIRIYWEDEEQPSVECPMYDLYGLHWCYSGHHTQPWSPMGHLNSLPVAVNPVRGVNCFWEMPFRKKCRMTAENISPDKDRILFYQINYTLTDVPDDAAYFHAQFRRTNPQPKGEVYTILDGVKGTGQFVGVSMGWGINHNGWWGEGEIKFYMDGDSEYPTICGTGLEDYFGGAWDWEADKEYKEYSTPFLGMYQVIKPDGLYSAQLRHALYRWHVMDPVRFESDLRVTIGALGHAEATTFQTGTHDICSTAFWYQTLPHQPFPALPGRDELLVV